MSSSTALCFGNSNARAREPILEHSLSLDDDRADEARTHAVTPSATLLAHGLVNRAIISHDLLRDWNQGQARNETTDTLPDSIRANWNVLARSGLAEETYARLNLLASKSAAWRGPGSKPLSGASVSRFLGFWAAVKSIAIAPELMLTPMGTIQAEWFRSRRQFLEIEFSGTEDNASFGLIDRRTRLEGMAEQCELVTLLRNFRKGIALTWSAA